MIDLMTQTARTMRGLGSPAGSRAVVAVNTGGSWSG